MDDLALPIALQRALTDGYTDIVLFAEVLLGMPLHEGQKKFLRDGNAKVNVLVPANRWGKSITVAIKHIHHCFYKVGVGRGNTQAHSRSHYRTANLAPHSDATKPVFDAIRAIMTSSFTIPQEDGSALTNDCKIGWFLKDTGIRYSTPYYIPFVNNSEILFRSTGEDKGDSIQGKPFGYISYDEGGRSNHLEYELDSNIIPRLADLRGSLDLVSTPDTSSASIMTHYELFEKGKRNEPGYYSQEGSISDNIFLLRNNPSYIEDAIKMYRGNPILDQVLYGKFVFGGDNLYPADQIEEAKDETLNDGERYMEGHQYVIGIDTAMGEDEEVFTVIDITKLPYRVVRIIGAKGNTKSPQMHMNDFIDLYWSYNKDHNVKIILETWNGESARFYQDLPPDMQANTKCFGSWQPPGVTTKMIGRNPRNVRKAEILIALQKILANREIKIPNNPSLVKQLSIYREDDTKLKTDRVMSLALAVWLATDGKPKNQTIELIEVDF